MTDTSAITAMSGDPKSQTLAVGNSNGYVIIFECDNQTEWKVRASVPTKEEIPVVSVGLIVKGGDNYYAVAYANGTVKLITPTGVIVAEIGAHSRGINALTCHP
jgi:WD40 repeat protein